MCSISAQTWTPVGSGAPSAVYAMEVFDDALFVGGTFTEIGGVSTNYLARWNGSQWSSIGGLITFMAADGLYANDTALFIGDGGRVRWWNNGPIQNLTGVPGSSFNSTAYSLAHFRDTLYVGGVFSSPFARIARWTGDAYGSLTTGCNAQVSALVPFNDRLFVGGNFVVAGDSLVNHTALWNGAQWDRMGAGVNNDVFTHCIFQDTLYIGGRFTTANGQMASRVAKWNGDQWVRVGGTLDDFVTTMTVYRDELYIGGAFTTPAHIARLEGSTWTSVGGGCNDNVRTMEVFHDTLFVGGSFTTAGGIAADRIAKWYLPEPPQSSFEVELPILCPNECTAFLDGSTNDPTTYAWSFPGGTPPTSDVPTPFVCYAVPGIYDVSLTVSNATGTSTSTLEGAVTVEVCTGIDGPNDVNMILAPNPARYMVWITLPEHVQRSTLTITDATGRVVRTRSFVGEQLQLDTRDLGPGTYMVSIVPEADHKGKAESGFRERFVVE